MVSIKSEIIRKEKFMFDISYINERGGRVVNEDSILVEDMEEKIFISIADGLGAHGGGDLASKVAIDVARKEYARIKKIDQKNIYRIFEVINEAIVAQQTEELKMKTTLSCVLCRNKYIYSAHLGDTRVYFFKDNRLRFMTKDHSVAYEEITKNHGSLEDIRKDPKRHILKAALGVGKIRQPDIFKQKIKNDAAVLICSDGFWEYVNENEMIETLTDTITAREWLGAMMKYHSEKADMFNDNYSAICLRITKNKGGKTLWNTKV